MPSEKADTILKKRKIFAKNLKAARIEAGLTQNDVVKITGLTQTFLSRVETAQTNISLDNALLLAEVVHQPLCKLLTSED
jgi:transcriptional regulator with XRE-family HTH domain